MWAIGLESEDSSLSCRLNGGGCSLWRTPSLPKIPVNREKYRENRLRENRDRLGTKSLIALTRIRLPPRFEFCISLGEHFLGIPTASQLGQAIKVKPESTIFLDGTGVWRESDRD
jgi:hypothetical protein